MQRRPGRLPRFAAFALRFFRLFPKAQPPQIGPLKPPPQPVIVGMLYAVWIGVTLALTVVLAGGIF